MSERDKLLEQRGGKPSPGIKITGYATGKPTITHVADVRKK